jgi:hypothetical protein
MSEMLTERKIKNRLRRQRQDATFDYFYNMTECVEKMLTEEERHEFREWDGKRPQGVPTSAWPGFEKHIGLPPWSKEKTAVLSPKLVSIRQGRLR